MNRIRLLSDNLGFSHLKQNGKLRRDAINRLRKTRKIGKIPPAFPNGWYAVAESRQVQSGDLIHVSALGQNLAVFRGTESGKVHVTNAYCPVNSFL